MPDDSSTSQPPPRMFRLTEVTGRLREVLLPVTAKQFWVRAQFVPEGTRSSGGHVYGQLVESDTSGRDVARLRVTIWKSDFERIEQKLGQDRLDVLRTGGEVCALCSVRYHPVFGLSLSLFDVDPDLGESKIDRNRRLILEGLQRDGLLERNRQLSVPEVALSIGLVTAAESAAYADFIKTLTMSGFAFRILHVAAQMQGAGTSNSIVAAVERLQVESLDLICVIRGGGSPIDLAWLDDDRIARAIANCQLPVWVGIGHEIDVGVLDHVAHTAHKTPTAVAEALVGGLREADARLTAAVDRLFEVTNRAVDLKWSELAVRENGLRQGARKHLQIQDARFAQRVSRFETLLAEQAERQASRFERAVTALRERTRALLDGSAGRLDSAAASLVRDVGRQVEAREQVVERSRAGLEQGTRKQLAAANDRLTRSPQTLRAIVERRTVRLIESLNSAAIRLRLSSESRQGAIAQRLAWLTRRITFAAYLRRLERAEEKIGERSRLLQATSPERLLERGYTITRNASGRIVRSIKDIAPGELVRTVLADGVAVSQIRETEVREDA